MKYNGLTKIGQNYLAKMQAENKAITFAKIKFGDGVILESENPANLEDIKKIKAEKSILEKKQKENAVELKTILDNIELTEGYYPREIGIYVNDDGVEKLYYYINDGNEASYLPPKTDGLVKMDITINLIATSETNISIDNAGKDLYVDKEYLDKELEKKENVITKKSGFNLEKTDSYNENDSNKLGTARALYNLYNWVKDAFTIPWSRITGKPNLTSTEDLNRLLNNKENAFSKNSAFNKNFGTSAGTVMEGDKFPIIQNNFKGIAGNNINPGFIQDSGTKNQGQFYLDRNTGKLHKCIKSTSSTTNNAEFFEDVSLDKLSDRLNNLTKKCFVNGLKIIKIGNVVNITSNLRPHTDFPLVNIIPVEFRPSTDVCFVGGNAKTYSRFVVKTDGTIDNDSGNSLQTVGGYTVNVTYSTA